MDISQEVAQDLLKAANEFIRKVECGEARSIRSYKQFKNAVEKHCQDKELVIFKSRNRPTCDHEDPMVYTRHFT